MRFRAALLLGAFLAVVTSSTAFGQGFQGGLRGAIKDSGGVIPGVEVTLTNERTNIGRNTVTNERGEYVFTNIDPGSYVREGDAAGLQDDRAARHPDRHAAVPDDGPHDGGRRDRGEHHGDRPVAASSRRRTHRPGTVLDSAALQTLPSPGRSAFLIGDDRSRPSSRRVTRSSTASRIRPTRRSCRSAAARAAAFSGLLAREKSW